MGHSREGSLTFLLSQFPSVVVTGHVLRELNQVSAGGGCPNRPWRARAKSDLQLGGPEAPAGLPPTCQGALALSGVLRRLQQVEDKILQVTALPVALPLPLSGAPSFPPLSPRHWVGSFSCCSRPVSCLIPPLSGRQPPSSLSLSLSLSPLSPCLQKRAQNLANREFHKKNIKEKAAHLASMFGHGDFPQVNMGLSEPPRKLDAAHLARWP